MSVVLRRALSVLVLTACLGVGLAPVGHAQDEPVQVPTQEIVPQPNSGQAPTEAGDRGGALQLLIFGLVVAAMAGATWHLVRQSRRTRAG